MVYPLQDWECRVPVYPNRAHPGDAPGRAYLFWRLHSVAPRTATDLRRARRPCRSGSTPMPGCPEQGSHPCPGSPTTLSGHATPSAGEGADSAPSRTPTSPAGWERTSRASRGFPHTRARELRRGLLRRCKLREVECRTRDHRCKQHRSRRSPGTSRLC